ncbi:MAG: hypothetical protein FD135_2737 [Comamonadaceae bacterium]|nr:MAG: hypothetical protein FD135_2737 [Comamonadaceae bacterium]
MTNTSHTSSLSDSYLGIYRVQWNTAPDANPSKSGVYLTQNDRNECWFKYFDAYWGQWYMSHAELRNHSPVQTTRIPASDLLSHVVAWAHRTRTV